MRTFRKGLILGDIYEIAVATFLFSYNIMENSF